MRILHVNKFLYRKGGAEGYMEDLAALQQRSGATVAFWGMDHPENTHVELAGTFPSYVDFDSPPSGVAERSRMVGRMVWSLQAQRGMAAAIERFRPDVAHLHNVYHQLSPSILTPLHKAGVPVVLTLHQGDDLGRPSRIQVELRADDTRIRVSGNAVPITGLE